MPESNLRHTHKDKPFIVWHSSSQTDAKLIEFSDGPDQLEKMVLVLATYEEKKMGERYAPKISLVVEKTK